MFEEEQKELMKAMQAKKDSKGLSPYEEGMLDILEVLNERDLTSLQEIKEEYV